MVRKENMTKYTYPEIPDFIIDHVGNEVRVGDYIVYAVRSGNTGAMCSGYVEGFQYPKDAERGRSYAIHNLKIKVKDPLQDRAATIEQSHLRYAKVVLPDAPVLDSDQTIPNT
jgi:hypothetical protein